MGNNYVIDYLLETPARRVGQVYLGVVDTAVFVVKAKALPCLLSRFSLHYEDGVWIWRLRELLQTFDQLQLYCSTRHAQAFIALRALKVKGMAD